VRDLTQFTMMGLCDFGPLNLERKTEVLSLPGTKAKQTLFLQQQDLICKAAG
jgi:hypothetical protein